MQSTLPGAFPFEGAILHIPCKVQQTRPIHCVENLNLKLVWKLASPSYRSVGLARSL